MVNKLLKKKLCYSIRLLDYLIKVLNISTQAVPVYWLLASLRWRAAVIDPQVAAPAHPVMPRQVLPPCLPAAGSRGRPPPRDGGVY